MVGFCVDGEGRGVLFGGHGWEWTVAFCFEKGREVLIWSLIEYEVELGSGEVYSLPRKWRENPLLIDSFPASRVIMCLLLWCNEVVLEGVGWDR